MTVVYVPFRPTACHIPRRTGVDWLAALVWLVLIPVSGVMGWYGLWRALKALWSLL